MSTGENEKPKKFKSGKTKSLLILLTLSVIISGCVTSPMPTKPPKPILNVENRPGGGVCLDEENTYRLMDYIYRLEDGYE